MMVGCEKVAESVTFLGRKIGQSKYFQQLLSLLLIPSARFQWLSIMNVGDVELQAVSAACV